jgi:hypothetical protein
VLKLKLSEGIKWLLLLLGVLRQLMHSVTWTLLIEH